MDCCQFSPFPSNRDWPERVPCVLLLDHLMPEGVGPLEREKLANIQKNAPIASVLSDQCSSGRTGVCSYPGEQAGRTKKHFSTSKNSESLLLLLILPNLFFGFEKTTSIVLRLLLR